MPTRRQLGQPPEFRIYGPGVDQVNPDRPPQEVVDAVREPQEENMAAVPNNAVGGAMLFPGAGSRENIDFAAEAGSKLYDRATATLYPKKEDKKYDLAADRAKGFLEKVHARARESNMLPLFMITIEGENDPRNFLENPHAITMDQVRSHVERHIVRYTCRRTQEDTMLYKMIESSLNEKANSKVLVNKRNYTTRLVPAPCPAILANQDLDGLPRQAQAAMNVEYYSGLLLLKQVISDSSVETASTTAAMERKMMNLNQIMIDSNYDIVKFHDEINDTQTELAKRNIAMTPSVTLLFDAYEKCVAEEFIHLLRTSKISHYAGTNVMTAPVLMATMEESYRSLLNDNKWTTAGETPNLVALQGQIKSLQSKLDGVQSGKSSKKDQKDNKKDGKANDGKKKDDWKFKNPKNKTTIKKDGKTFNWCKYHGDGGKWVEHSLDACRLNPNNPGYKPPKDKDQKSKKDKAGKEDEKKKKSKKEKKSIQWKTALKASTNGNDSNSS
jgi:hypothetical protein